MPIYKLKLIDRREIVKGIILFAFEKPEGFTFKPGQYAGFTLIDPTETDAAGITRRFSLLGTPQDTHLTIAMRFHDKAHAYKRVLNQLAIGQEIKFAGPTGNFVLPEDNSTPVVLIAGGIGITPFYCMIKHELEQNSTRPIYLFYGNQSPQDTAFLNEFQALEKNHSNFKFIPTVLDADTNWKGETGYINHLMIKKYIPDLSVPIYYVCGSPSMVTTLQETLVEMEINEERIKVEDFPGY